jgi:creatinine amidohydrolase
MRWEDLTAPELDVLDRDRTVVVLPIGSVEQHGRHMPVGTDTMLAHGVALAAADRFGDGWTLVLPPPWYGFSSHHMRFPGTVTLAAETLMRLVDDIVRSVVAHEFQRIVVVNGHGGNAGIIDVLAATLGHRFHGIARIACLTYFTLAREAIAALRESKPGGMGHACEFETAMMLHLHPGLVKMDQAVSHYPDPGSRFLTTDLLGAAPVRTYLDFRDLSPSGTFGDPSLASAEKGAGFLAASADALAAFLADFATWPIPGD